MSGFFGLWHLDGRPATTSHLNQCCERNTAQRPHGCHSWLEGSVGLACNPASVAPEAEADRQPLVCGHIGCVFDGRLDDRLELANSLDPHPLLSRGFPDSTLVLAAYDRFGDAFVDRLKGDFALAVFDRRTNRLLLARDRLGLRPLCYTQCADTFLFASEAKALLAYPGMQAVPDERMVADFLLYFLAADGQTRTFFQGVHSLPPAHVLTVTLGRATLRRYFEFDTLRRIRFSDFRSYVGAFHDRFVASVRNRLRTSAPVAISVSGGRDSSYIYCVAQRLAREEPGLCPAVIGFNYGGPPGTPSDESGFVRELERAFDAKIERIGERPGFIECAGEEVCGTESPVVESLACLRRTVLRRVTETGAHRLLTGHWGDQLLEDSDYLLDLLRSGRWRTFDRHRRQWGIGARQLAARCARDLAERHLTPSLRSGLRWARSRLDGAWKAPWFTPRFRQILVERFTADRLHGTAGASHGRAMYQQIRRGYFLQCMQWNSGIGAVYGVDMAFPYLDCDLIQFLMSIPGDVHSRNGVPRGLMREAMRGIVPDAIIERRSKGEFTHLSKAGIEHDFVVIRELLGRNALAVQFGYVDGPFLWKTLDEWRSAIRTADDSVIADRIIDLCGLELFLRCFFSNDRAGGVSNVPRPVMPDDRATL